MCSLTEATAPSHDTVCYVSDMINLQLSAAFVAWAATTFLAHFSVKQILTTVAPAGVEVTSITVTVTVTVAVIADLQISKSPMGPTKKSGEAL